MGFPPRDRRWSLYLIGTCAAAGLAAFIFPLPLAGAVKMLSGGGLVLLLANHLLLKIPLFPYDRIWYAVSDDGLRWTPRAAACMDVGGLHHSCQVYYPDVVSLPQGWRMYYRAGGYDSIIASAFSADGEIWQEEPGERIGRGGPFRLQKVDGPEVVLSGESWRMYYAGYGQEHWRIYTAASQDGLNWCEPKNCIDLSREVQCPQVKDPALVRWGTGYRIYFIRFAERPSTIYTAVSEDGLEWHEIRPCTGYGPEGCDIRTPCVVQTEKGTLRMYFAEFPRMTATGSRIVYADSDDGIAWRRGQEICLGPGALPGLHGAFCPDLIRSGKQWRMYYGGYWGRHWLSFYTRFRHREKKGSEKPSANLRRP